MKIYSPDDFDFLPEGERVLAAQQFNIGAEAATSSTANGGAWSIPEFDQSIVDRMFKESIHP